MAFRRDRHVLLILSLSICIALTALDTFGQQRPVSTAAPRTLTTNTSGARTTPAQPGNPQAGPQAGPEVSQEQIVARVNGEPITRKQLGERCLIYFGQDVAERMVNKFLILSECKRLNITITRADIRAEIERMATSFKLPVTQWLNLLKNERGISEQQYSEDIVWPSLAMKAIAKGQIQVSDEDLNKAYVRNFGPQIEARIIVLDSASQAQQIHDFLTKNMAADPECFSKAAKEHSIDTATASVGGKTPVPLRRYSGNDQFDNMVFALKEGEISPVTQVADQYIIVLCEKINPGTMDKVKLADIAPQLKEELANQNLQRIAESLFRQLQENAKVVLVLGNPELEAKYPSAAILINGQQVSRTQVAEKCIERHGPQALKGFIEWTIIAQAAKKANITITEEEIDQEITRQAIDCLPPKADGSPDIEKFYSLMKKEQNITPATFRKNIWPMLVLRKIVANQVTVEQEDIRKGYEANFGPRVLARAIILADMRTAQRVWAEVRKNPTEQNFGDLCQQFSCDQNNQAIRGEMPPIQKHGGFPELESEAFKLKKGELSDIITVGNRFVILLCLGQTVPENIKLEDVKDDIAKDVHFKKEQVMISQKVEELIAASSWENLLTGETQSPQSTQNPAANPVAEPRSGSQSTK